MPRTSRRSYLDWLRGVAVLIMIEAHVFDSWTRFPDNRTREFAYAMILGGFGAPLFLFLAGVIVPLSAGSKLRRSGDRGRRVARRRARGLQIFGAGVPVSRPGVDPRVGATRAISSRSTSSTSWGRR